MRAEPRAVRAVQEPRAPVASDGPTRQSSHGPTLGPTSVAWLIGGFTLTRVAVQLAGVRFDATPVSSGWHFIDPARLGDDFLRSLWFLHVQPPLFNAFLGMVVRLPRPLETPALFTAYLAVGLALTLAVARLMIELGVSRRAATAVTLVFVAGPANLLYERWVFYTYPMAALLCVAALLLLRYARTGRTAWGAAFFAALASACLMRSLYSVVWFVGIAVLVLVGCRPGWRSSLAAAGLPFLAVAALVLKNLLVFDYPGTSTWMGMTLSLGTTFEIPLGQRKAMVQDGRLSAFALVPPFSPLDRYSALLPPSPPTGVPVLDRVNKDNGAVNYNNRAYIEIDRRYLRDALRAVRARPDLAARGAARSMTVFFAPAADYKLVAANRQRIDAWFDTYATAVEGRLGERPRPRPGYPASRPGLVIVAVYAVAAAYGIGVIWRVLRRRSADPARDVVVAFLGATVLYVLAIATAVDVGENNRFRFEVDALALVTASVAASSLLARRRARRRGPAPPLPP